MLPRFIKACIVAVALTPACGWAETLDDKDIRAVAVENDGPLNAEKTLANMQKRLDDDFVTMAALTRVVDNDPAVVSNEAYSKKEMIENAMQNLKSMKSMSENKTKVIEIRYSDDKKFAYVSDEQKVVGTMDLLLKNGKTGLVSVDAVTKCKNTLTLKDEIIRILRSDCTYLSHITTPN